MEERDSMKEGREGEMRAGGGRKEEGEGQPGEGGRVERGETAHQPGRKVPHTHTHGVTTLT